MWSEKDDPPEDPLRQGDLLDGIVFPILKLPLQEVDIESAPGVLVPAKTKFGLVVSQCCDNEGGDYVALAHVQTRGGLTPEQTDALRREEPGDSLAGYQTDEFLLEPIDGVLEVKNDRTHWVALLTRTISFWGPECTALRTKRRARMTPTGRRLLRINVGLHWSRVEKEDAAALDELGLPHGLRP